VANTGNVALRQLNITLDGVTLLCEGQNMSSVVPHLSVSQHVACGGSFSFSQDTLEAGSRNFSAAGSASNLDAAGAASNVVEVVVAASPQLQLDVDALNCSRPAQMREFLVLSVDCAVMAPLWYKNCIYFHGSCSIGALPCTESCYTVDLVVLAHRQSPGTALA
jgi:hypothetical protein